MSSSEQDIRLARLDDLKRKLEEVLASGFKAAAEEDPREALKEMVQARAADDAPAAAPGRQAGGEGGGEGRGALLRKLLAARQGGGAGDGNAGVGEADRGALLRRLMEARQNRGEGGGAAAGGGAGEGGEGERPMLRKFLEARLGKGQAQVNDGNSAEDQKARRERLKRLLTKIKKDDSES